MGFCFCAYGVVAMVFLRLMNWPSVRVVIWFWPSAPSELLWGSRYSEGEGMAEETGFLFWLLGVEELLASSVAACFCSILFVSVCCWRCCRRWWH